MYLQRRRCEGNFWSKSLRLSQAHLTDCAEITAPTPQDQLWIVTDASTGAQGLGATTYVSSPGTDSVKLAGFYSAKLRKTQESWYPCELEGLAIAGAIQHNAPFIINSERTSIVCTDSKACVQAFSRLARGEFSSSPRVTSFLWTASRYRVELRHLAGESNLPSDFASRHLL